MFVNILFDPKVKTELIFERDNNPEVFEFISRDENFKQLIKETGTTLRLKDNKVLSEGQTWQNNLAFIAFWKHI